jgi:hypothetical protein
MDLIPRKLFRPFVSERALFQHSNQGRSNNVQSEQWLDFLVKAQEEANQNIIINILANDNSTFKGAMEILPVLQVRHQNRLF